MYDPSLFFRQRQKFRKASISHDVLCNDLHELVESIQNPIKLKDGTKHLYSTHVKEKIQAVEVNPDIQKEYGRQRQYLDRSVGVLKR